MIPFKFILLGNIHLIQKHIMMNKKTKCKRQSQDCELISQKDKHVTLSVQHCQLLPSGEMAIPQYTGRVADWILNEEAPDAFTEAITFMTLMTMAR